MAQPVTFCLWPHVHEVRIGAEFVRSQVVARKTLLVNQCVRRFQQQPRRLRIRSAKAPALTPRGSNSFDLLQLNYSLSMNVI